MAMMVVAAMANVLALWDQPWMVAPAMANALALCCIGPWGPTLEGETAKGYGLGHEELHVEAGVVGGEACLCEWVYACGCASGGLSRRRPHQRRRTHADEHMSLVYMFMYIYIYIDICIYIFTYIGLLPAAASASRARLESCALAPWPRAY